MTLELAVVTGIDAGKVFALEADDESRRLIGRRSPAIYLTDKTVSRRHAEVWCDGHDWYVQDLGSSNGSFLNGTRIRQATPLQDGDRLLLGDLQMVASLWVQVALDAEQEASTAHPPATVQPSSNDSQETAATEWRLAIEHEPVARDQYDAANPRLEEKSMSLVEVMSDALNIR